MRNLFTVFNSMFGKLPTLRENPQKEFDRLFGPQIDHPYFCKRRGMPYVFKHESDVFEMVNAAWLADAALLAYVPNHLDNRRNFDIANLTRAGWKVNFVSQTLKSAGFHKVKFFNRKGTQCFVAHNKKAVIVSFRGTEVKEFADLIHDGMFLPSLERGGKVHLGFQAALNAVWRSHKGKEGVAGYLQRVSSNGSIPMWFTGHSLGAALAIIAAGRWNAKHPVKGLYTFGSPGVGNKKFTSVFKKMNVVRVVHNEDIITKASQPPDLSHVGKIYFITSQKEIIKNTKLRRDEQNILDKVSKVLFLDLPRIIWKFSPNKKNQIPRLLADHAPRFYSNHLRRAV